ncbi:hypothetical protein BDR07DRAFT_864130 [Suillus spraguei]|nr:hypothetical protein BDR07DRAFT_864130 [Suillus spraguei]
MKIYVQQILLETSSALQPLASHLNFIHGPMSPPSSSSTTYFTHRSAHTLSSLSLYTIPPSFPVAGKANVPELNVGPVSQLVLALPTVISFLLPSKRIPTSFYVPINVDSRRRWKSTIRVISSDESESWAMLRFCKVHSDFHKRFYPLSSTE